MAARSSIAPVVRWFARLRGLVPGWTSAILLVGSLAFAGPAQAASLSPGDMLIVGQTATDSGPVGSVFAANPANGAQTRVAVGGSLVNPTGIAIGLDTNAYVVDPSCCASGTQPGVIRVNFVTGDQTVISSGGQLGYPVGITFWEAGILYVVDLAGAVIQVDRVTGQQTVVTSGQHLRWPTSIVAALPGLYVTDLVLPGVVLVNPVTGAQTVVSSGGHIFRPKGIAIAANGDLLVADQTGIIMVNPVDGTQTVIVSTSQPGPLKDPVAIAVGSQGDPLVLDPTCCGGGLGGVIRVNVGDGSESLVAQGGSLPLAAGIAVLPGAPASPVSSCGGAVPCACGDRVVRDRKLRGDDPVTRTVCGADGLVVASGVTLDLGGATLRGRGAGAGVRIEAGATRGTVRNGAVAAFSTGVHGERVTGVSVTNVRVRDSAHDGIVLSGDRHAVEKSRIEGSVGLGLAVVGRAARLSRLEVTGNGGAGVRLLGDGHVLEKSDLTGNAGHGVEVRGDGNQLLELDLEGNGGDGMLVNGTGNRAAKSSAARNRGMGLNVQGDRASIEKNESTKNDLAGLRMQGAGHRVSANVVEKNAQTGISVVGTTGSQFDRNQSEGNGGVGIVDDSAGSGTGGTANSHTKNVCGTGNAGGPSSPAGLCR